MAFLRASDSPPVGIEFDRVPFGPFELHLGPLSDPPAELHLDAHGDRVEAFPDGCAWVV
jgi:hypothetical protein